MRSVITSKSSPAAEEICQELHSWLRGSIRTGIVHSVFHSSVNLLFGSRLVTMLTVERPLYPFSMRFSCQDFPGISVGDSVRITDKELSFPILGRIYSIEKAKSTDLTLASLEGQLAVPPVERWQELRKIIVTDGKTDGFAPLLGLLEKENDCSITSNLYADYAAQKIPALFAAIRANDPVKAGEAAYSIAGCGIGLTPSADDFLCGVMTVLKAISIARKEAARLDPLIRSIADSASPRTNLVSATFLGEAAQGLLSRDVRQLIQSLFSSVLSQSIKPSAMNVIAFGETSGTDILTGIYFGQKIYPN